GTDTCSANTPCASNPGFALSNRIKLAPSKVTDASNTNARATSAVTNTHLALSSRGAGVVPRRSTSRTLHRLVIAAGTYAHRAAHAEAMKTMTAITDQLTVTCRCSTPPNYSSNT